MKTYVALAALALCLLTSCVRKQVVLTMADQRDSLACVVNQKDSLLNAVFEDIHAIANNLSQIKVRENLLTVPAGGEGASRPVEQIHADIAAIDRLLQENKSKIASLRHAAAQLRKANLRIEALEKMIRDLDNRLAAKAEEIDRLRADLAASEMQMERMARQIAERETEVLHLNDENMALTTQLHTVYYIVGSEKELREAQIINKEGFIVRTLTMGRNHDIQRFTKADARQLDEIPIMQKKATIVTPHPTDSYEMVAGADKRTEKLLITDPGRFWESSKVLIVSYKQ